MDSYLLNISHCQMLRFRNMHCQMHGLKRDFLRSEIISSLKFNMPFKTIEILFWRGPDNSVHSSIVMIRHTNLYISAILVLTFDYHFKPPHKGTIQMAYFAMEVYKVESINFGFSLPTCLYAKNYHLPLSMKYSIWEPQLCLWSKNTYLDPYFYSTT